MRYNDTMTNVIIRNAACATDAASWCLDHLDSGQWNIEVIHFCTPGVNYRFSFKDKTMATFFSLKFS